MIFRILFLSTFCLFYFNFCVAATQNDARINEILTYWFGDLQTPDDYPHDHSKIWFGGSVDVDQEIRSRFEHLVVDAANHKLDEWKQTPKGRLALILLVDQFSRNIYRGTPDAFAFDAIAQELTLEGLNLGQDRELFPIERVFFYLPLEHSENLEIQELSIAQFNELVACVMPSLTSIFKSYAAFSRKAGTICSVQPLICFPASWRIRVLAAHSRELRPLTSVPSLPALPTPKSRRCTAQGPAKEYCMCQSRDKRKASRPRRPTTIHGHRAGMVQCG